MTKFKVGDRVKVIATVTGARGARIGDIGTIKVVGGTDLKYAVEFDNPSAEYHNAGGYCMEDHGYWCSDEMLELAKPETIVIYRKDNEVIALDKSTGKKAIARCCPKDTFDFETGAKLAFDRLLINNKFGAPNIREVKRIAKVGEYIKIVNPSGCISDEHKAGDILKVIKVDDLGAYYKDKLWKYAEHSEYVVLEGYEPEEPEEPKKQPYNGKIIFTKGDDTFRTGRIYEIKDGRLEDQRGYGLLPGFRHEGYDTFYSIEDVKDYFTAKSKLHNGYGWSPYGLEFIEVQDD